MTAELGDGRHGPVYLGIDTATEHQVVIRTFVVSLTDEGRERFLDGLAQLCDQPLEHAAIARPLACGEVDGVPFLVHTFLPGLPLDEYLRLHGRRSLSEVSLRVMHLAGAIDFAAAAGVVHGSLGPRDLLLAEETTGIAGFGIAQALHEAGAEPHAPSTADDLYALAAMTYEMLVGERFEGGDVHAVLASLPLGPDVDVAALSRTLHATLSPDPAGWPASALQFAASLHDTLLGPESPLAAAPSDAPPAAVAESATGEVRWDDPAPPGPEPSAVAPPIPVSVPPHREAAVRASTGEPPQTLPLFDAPMRAPVEPAYGTVPPPHAMDADLALRGGEPAIPLNPRRESAVPPPFLSTATTSGGSGRLMQVAAVGALLVIAGAVFLLLGQPSLFDGLRQSPAAPASVGESDTVGADSRLDDAPDTATPPGAAADAVPEATPGGGDGRFAAVPPVLSDGPVAEREVGPAPVPPQETPIGGTLPSRSNPAPASPGDAAAAAPGAAPLPPAPPPSAAAGTRASAPAREPAATTVAGRVLVRSDPPGAQVFIDGEPRGQTPVAIRDLPLGTLTITVSAPGLAVWQQQVTLTADRPAQSFEITLGSGSGRAPEPPPVPSGPASLEIESRPTGAQVWVDGRLVGTTPLQMADVEEGSHAVRLELPGYRTWTTSVSVARGARARVAASLEQ